MRKWIKGDVAMWREQRVILVLEKMRGWIVKEGGAGHKLWFADAGELYPLGELAKLAQEMELSGIIARLFARASDVSHDCDKDLHYEIDSETAKILRNELEEAAQMLTAFKRMHFPEDNK